MAVTCGVTSGGTRARTLATVRSSHREDGLMALELAIVTPVVIVMLLTVVAFGRITHGRQLVDDAAAIGGRAAALATTPGQAESDARAAIGSTLNQAGISCKSTSVTVDTSNFHAGGGGSVAVNVRCVTGLTGLALTGLPGSVTLTADSLTPIETYREIG